MRITAYSYTNQGGREHNEDSVRCASGEAGSIFLLADGLGGHGCGEVASRMAVDSIYEGCTTLKTASAEMLLTLMNDANNRILNAQSSPEQSDMRTTAVALHIADQRAAWAYAGDSRLYHLSGGQIAHVTKDHSVTYRKYMGGEISYMDIYHDDDRTRLMRVLGKENCRPEGEETEVVPGDAFLLCSDGFWEYVYDEEILIDFLKSESPAQWARNMLLRHIRRAAPGNDNFSLITVFVEEET